MKTPVTATLVAFAFLMFVLTFAFTNQFQGSESVTIGSLTVPENEQNLIRTLVNRTNGAGSGNYDSFDFPRGTTFQVPADHEFIISKLNVDGRASGTTIRIGYGDNAVADSGTPPTNAEIIWSQDITGDIFDPLHVFLVIPEGKVPFMQDTGGTWNMSIAGILRETRN